MASGAARLFGGGTARPPYSDGPAGFKALLSRAGLTAITSPGQPAAGAALLVIDRFAELEACFDHAGGPQPAAARLARLLALTDAAIGLADALRREHPQAYARFAGASPAVEEQGSADAR